jgi:hypothetical protein
VVAVAIALDEAERGKKDGIVEILEGLIAEVIFEDAAGFQMIHGEKALVVARVGRESRLITEQDGKKTEARDVVADDDEANGDGRGKH